MPRLDPTALLCESCGYPIGELPREGNCPECGRAFAESLPERRVGTPWQRKPGVGAWVRTNVLVIRQPRRMWSLVQVETTGASSLLVVNASLAVTAMCGVHALLLLATSSGLDSNQVLGIIGVACGISLFGSLGLLTLCAIEYGGIRFFGARRRWRVTHEVAVSVVGHASVGWLLAPITLPLCWSVAAAILDPYGGAFEEWPGAISSALLIVAALGGPLIPLFAFEALVYVGVRRMRFANMG